MQRLSNEYISSVTENKKEESIDVPRVLKNDLYEKLPDTSETKQIKALQSLKQLADNFDNLNATWEADDDILNSEPFLEEHLILKKIRTLRATVRMTPCPILLNKNGFIPIAQLKPRSQRQLITIICPMVGERKKKLAELSQLLTNLTDFLLVRGFQAELIGRRDGEAFDLDGEEIDNFLVTSQNGCLSASKSTDGRVLSGAIITDAQSSDELVLKLLVTTDQSADASKFLTLTRTFYQIGIEKAFLSESCEILNEEIYNWYFDVLFRKNNEILQNFNVNSAEFREYIYECLKSLSKSGRN